MSAPSLSQIVSNQTMHLPLLEGPWRISIVGCSGSGKTTLARRLAAQLQIPHIEMDGLFWGRNWQAAGTEEFRDRIGTAVAQSNWVIDGNYRQARDLVWQRATLILWLDYPRWRVMQQIIWRTCKRVFLAQPLWNDNRENWRQAFLSRDSMIYYAWHTHPKRRQEYSWLFSLDEFEGRVVRLRSHQETQAFLNKLPTASKAS
ncbi:MAG TPA: AAA family ATPase [Trichocoleus sp.]